MGDILSGIQAALAPSKVTGDVPIVGAVGGYGQLDSGLTGFLGEDGLGAMSDYLGQYKHYIDVIQGIDDPEQGDNAIYRDNVQTIIGSESTSPVVIGAVGGDLSINTGADTALMDQPVSKGEATTIDRYGDVEMQINGGNVIGGAGGSAAISIGNISADVTGTLTALGLPDQRLFVGTIKTQGNTETKIHGSVSVNANNGANVGGFATGGLAIAVGGNASSEVTENTEYIASNNGSDGKLDGINAGIAAGGAAISTLGGVATSTVGGDASIISNSGLSVGLIGGGAAASVDATGIYGLVKNEVGKDDGSSNTDIGLVDNISIAPGVNVNDVTAHVDIQKANDGGSATSTVGGNVNIDLKGTTTAAGVIGGGLAAAEHMYAGRFDTATKNQPIGSSTATSTVEGDTTITIALDKTVEEIGNVDTSSLQSLANANIVVGVAGGGAAAAFGDANTTAKADSQNTTIDIQKGYVTGAFGGGIAVAAHDKNTQRTQLTGEAETNPDHLTAAATVKDTNIIVGADSKAVGVFGNGLAVGMEFDDKYHEKFDTPDTPEPNKLRNPDSGTNAYVEATNTNVTIAGSADAVFGGGLLLSNGAYGGDSVTLDTKYKSTITVDGGHVENTSFAFLNTTLQKIGQAVGISKNEDGETPNLNQNVLGGKVDHYIDDLDKAAGNVAILGGHVAVGQGGYAHTNESVINIANGGTVKGDIVAGGISDVVAGTYGTDATASGVVVDKSTINLAGDSVDGSIYAGGIKVTDSYEKTEGAFTTADYSMADSIVKDSTVNLMGMDIAGEISGAGYEYTKYTNSGKQVYGADLGTSTLKISGTNTLSALGAGKYTSDSKIHDFDEVNVEAGSVTKLDGETVKADSTALIDGGLITTDRTAQIDLNDLEVNVNDSAYKIASNTAKGSTFWTHEDQLAYDRTEKYAVLDSSAEDNGHYNVTMKTVAENAADAGAAAEEAYGVAGLKDAFANQLNTGWKDHEGAKGYFSATSSAGQYTLGGRGMLFGEDAAVTGNTASIARLMADNVMQRLSFTDDYVKDAGWVNEDGGIWAKYVHNKYETSGMSSSVGGIRSSTDYDGAIVGVDIAKNGNFQYGAAIHYGSGDGDGIISHNDYDAWGLALYASLKDEEAGTNLMADIGWLTTDNDIDGTVNGKSMSADRDVDAWTIGVRGEKEFVSGQNQIVPYVGLRYMSINPGAYSVYWGGEKFSSYDADNQNLWLLPIGVSFRNETVTGAGWRITPKLDLSYIWAFGDTDTNVNLDLGNSLYYDVMDDDSWLASLGIEATKDVWSFGVGYGYQKGDDTKNKTWFVNASYAF